MANATSENGFDAVLPPEMAVRAAEIGARKARMPLDKMFALAVLAGAFIALGAAFSTTVTAGSGPTISYGFSRLVGGLSFSLGLILVVVAGAELFTGNNLIVLAFASKRISLADLLRNWGVVYVGNLVGAVATAAVVFASGQYLAGDGAVGAKALNIARAKCELGAGTAFVLGVLCNALVCLAVWLCYSCRTTTDKILAVLFPITAFVACGFEHSIANMYFIPLALFVKESAPLSFWSQLSASSSDFGSLTWAQFGLNLVPVTLGNVVGGAVLVGLVYWFVYLRGRHPGKDECG